MVCAVEVSEPLLASVFPRANDVAPLLSQDPLHDGVIDAVRAVEVSLEKLTNATGFPSILAGKAHSGRVLRLAPLRFCLPYLRKIRAALLAECPKLAPNQARTAD